MSALLWLFSALTYFFAGLGLLDVAPTSAGVLLGGAAVFGVFAVITWKDAR